VEQLEEIRVQKLKEIENLGGTPYPTFYKYTHTLCGEAFDSADYRL